MTAAVVTVQRSGHAVVQDLGRTGFLSIGVSGNGAADRRSARTANTLVGNPDGAALVEITASVMELTTDSALLVAVTGAASHVLVDGHEQPAWEALRVSAGSRISVPQGPTGFRSYLAVNGCIDAPRALGSVSPDPLLGVGVRLETGARLTIDTGYDDRDVSPLPSVFRFGARPSQTSATVEVRATPGPDLDRMALGATALDAPLTLLPQSDHVGLRFAGSTISLTSTDEILSRGVPVGAVEVVPSGDVVILMRGRLGTAGYPVVAVVTSTSLDDLAQARPGDTVRITLCDLASARRAVFAGEEEHRDLAARVRRALESRGLGQLVAPDHASRRDVLEHKESA